MNSFLCNISLISLIISNYNFSPIFAKSRFNLNFKDINIVRSFSSFSYNNKYILLKNSRFSNILDKVINVANNGCYQFTGYFPTGLNLNGINGKIEIHDSLFHNILSRAIIQNNDKYTSISILNSQFVNINNENVIELQKGSSLFVNSTCFYDIKNANSVFKINIFLECSIQLNFSSFISIESRNSLIDCSNCSFSINNANVTSSIQKAAPLMIFSSINYFSIIYLNLMNSISSCGFHFTNHIDLANFTLINVNNLGIYNKSAFVFHVVKGSIFVYYSSFNINSKLIDVNSSTAFFYRCNASVRYNYLPLDRMIRTISCFENMLHNELLSANPDFYVPLIYCEDGSHPNPDDIQIMINEGKEKTVNVQQKGATEILGIILFCVLGVSIVGLSLWLILYFVVFKNRLRRYDNDDQMAKWKQRWEWICVNTDKAKIEHKDCSDMEIDPIELSETAIKRRHQKLYDDEAQSQISESQKSFSEGLAEISSKKQTKSKKQKKKKTSEMEENLIQDEDRSESMKDINVDIDEILIDDDYEPSESLKNKNGIHKTQNLRKTSIFNSIFKDPKTNKGKATGDEEKAKSIKIHFNSSDEGKKREDHEEDKSDGVISESDDLDADNDKYINNLEKAKGTWNRFRKTGIDKSLGVIEESSDSSWGFKNKNFTLSKPIVKDEQFNSSNIWSDDSKDKDDDDDDDDIWSDNADAEDDGDSDSDI